MCINNKPNESAVSGEQCQLNFFKAFKFFFAITIIYMYVFHNFNTTLFICYVHLTYIITFKNIYVKQKNIMSYRVLTQPQPLPELHRGWWWFIIFSWIQTLDWTLPRVWTFYPFEANFSYILKYMLRTLLIYLFLRVEDFLNGQINFDRNFRWLLYASDS